MLEKYATILIPEEQSFIRQFPLHWTIRAVTTTAPCVYLTEVYKEQSNSTLINGTQRGEHETKGENSIQKLTIAC